MLKSDKPMVKEAAAIYTPERMAVALENCARYNWAREERDKVVKAADRILELPVGKLLRRMPSPNMIRDMWGHCPHCGWTTMGTPGKNMDIIKTPWKTGCPSCEKNLPGFDAEAYFISGRDARGWFQAEKADAALLPKDEKFRQTALQAMQSYCYHYWCHLGNALSTLGEAYAYSGEARYGRYALSVMTRFADFYPHFKKEDTRGDTHPGAMIQDGWEAYVMKQFALAYDAVFALAGDAQVLEFLKRYRQAHALEPLADGTAVKRHIEANVYGVIAGDRYERMNYEGYGMRSNVMSRIMYLNAHRGHVAPETIGMVLGDTPLGRAYLEEAAKLAFKGFEKDGSNLEGAMSYDMGGFDFVRGHHRDVVRFAPNPPVDVWKDPTVQAAYELYFDLFCISRYYPKYGDTGTCGGHNGMFIAADRGVPSLDAMREANRRAAFEYALLYQSTGVERFARIAWYLNAKSVDGLRLTVWDKDPEAIREKIRAVAAKSDEPVERSFVAPQLGIAVLKSGEGDGRRALWLRANRRNQRSEAGWHGHADSMNLGLFGYGLDLMPELGYMDQKVWVFGHNTVSLQTNAVPEASKEKPRLAAQIRAEIRSIRQVAPGIQAVWSQGTDNRDSHRIVFLVDVDAEIFYIVDAFRVGASVQAPWATYAFHTFQGAVTGNVAWAESADKIEGTSRMGGQWLPPLFDAPACRTEAGGEGGRTQAAAPWWVEVSIEDTYGVLGRPSDVKLRFTALRPSDRVFHTHYAPPKAEPEVPKRLPYFFLSLARPEAGNAPRRFASIIEPYRTKRPVRAAAIVATSPLEAEVIVVEESSGRKLTFIANPEGKAVTLPDGTVVTEPIAVRVDAPPAKR